MEQDAKRVGRQAPEPYPEPARQTPEPYPEPEKMMEPNAKRVGRQTPEPYPEPRNDDGTKPVSWKNWEPHSAPELFGEKLQNNVYIVDNLLQRMQKILGQSVGWFCSFLVCGWLSATTASHSLRGIPSIHAKRAQHVNDKPRGLPHKWWYEAVKLWEPVSDKRHGLCHGTAMVAGKPFLEPHASISRRARDGLQEWQPAAFPARTDHHNSCSCNPPCHVQFAPVYRHAVNLQRPLGAIDLCLQSCRMWGAVFKAFGRVSQRAKNTLMLAWGSSVLLIGRVEAPAGPWSFWPATKGKQPRDCLKVFFQSAQLEFLAISSRTIFSLAL